MALDLQVKRYTDTGSPDLEVVVTTDPKKSMSHMGLFVRGTDEKLREEFVSKDLPEVEVEKLAGKMLEAGGR